LLIIIHWCRPPAPPAPRSPRSQKGGSSRINEPGSAGSRVVGRVFTELLVAFFGADMPEDFYALVQSAAATLPPDDVGLIAMGLRGGVPSHRESIRIRTGVADRWHRLFREWDVLLCPVVPTRMVGFRRTQNGREN
jgi:hypothetical protein